MGLNETRPSTASAALSLPLVVVRGYKLDMVSESGFKVCFIYIGTYFLRETEET